MALDSAFWQAERQRMFEILFPVILDAARDGALRASGVIGLDVSWDLINERAQAWANGYTYQLVSGINATSERLLQKSVSDWIASGARLDVLTETIEPMFGPIRAGMIAVTEVTRAYSEGNRVAWEASGVVGEYEFRTAQDDLVCPVCGPEDGKRYALGDTSHAPPLHVNCILPDNEIGIPGQLSAVVKSRYVGGAIEITTRSGRILSITENHPILTSRGWIVAKLLREGDDVLRALDTQRMMRAIYPDNDARPAMIQQVFNAWKISFPMLAVRMPVTTEDFYGDGRFVEGDIEVIRANRLLMFGHKTPVFEPGYQVVLDRGGVTPESLFAEGLPLHSAFTFSPPSDGIMGGTQQGLAGFATGVSPTQIHGIRDIAGGNTSIEQTLSKSPAIDPRLAREFLLRFSGEIARDEVIKVRNFEFTGHVYDLQVDPYELYTCNDVIVKNCRCWLQPVVREAP